MENALKKENPENLTDNPNKSIEDSGANNIQAIANQKNMVFSVAAAPVLALASRDCYHFFI